MVAQRSAYGKRFPHKVDRQARRVGFVARTLFPQQILAGCMITPESHLEHANLA